MENTTPGISARPPGDDTEAAASDVLAGNGMPVLLRAETPDAEVWPLLRLSNALVGDPDGREVQRIRAAWNVAARAVGGSTPVDAVEDRDIDGPAGSIRLRIYRPTASTDLRPAFVWFHGGAFLIGGIETADSICRRIASESGAIVVSVRYRLAPENDLHAGREDGCAAVEWVARNGASIGVDPSRIAVGGDSAGGNISAMIAQECVRRGGPALRLQVLVYPATNLEEEFPSHRENAHGYLLTAAAIDWIRSVVGPHDTRDVALSPAYNDDWRDLAPALIVTAGFDPVRDDGLAYAQRLRGEGIPVELLHYPGQVHGFINFDSVLRTARDALDRIGASLETALADRSGPSGNAGPPDRTIEIRTAQTFRETLLSNLAIGGLQVGEWIELKRNRLIVALSPKPLSASLSRLAPLVSPVTAIRHSLAQRHARLEAYETYNATVSSA